MGRMARVGVVCLMGLAVGLARLVEVELQPEGPATAIEGAGRPAEPAEDAAGTPAAEVATAGSPAPTPDPAQPWPRGRTYVVCKGDTLGAISQKVYGSTRFWKAIQTANGGLDPKKVRPGMELLLPEVDAGR